MPGRSIPKIMERKKKKQSQNKKPNKNGKGMLRRRDKGNLDEMSIIIIKGKWDTIQKAIGKEYSTIEEKDYPCEDCKGKAGRKKDRNEKRQ